MTATERQRALECDLQRSLREFDEKLARERNKLARERETTGDVGRRGGEGDRGGTTGRASAGAPASSGGENGNRSGALSGPAGASSARRGEGENTKLSRPPVPPDIPSGTDDDIVARQIREAAMSEEDPDLRAKLWQEYRDYKSGRGGTSKSRKGKADPPPREGDEDADQPQDESGGREVSPDRTG